MKLGRVSAALGWVIFCDGEACLALLDIAYLPLLVLPVLSSPNQYQFSSSELALCRIAPPWAWIKVPEVSVKLILG